MVAPLVVQLGMASGRKPRATASPTSQFVCLKKVGELALSPLLDQKTQTDPLLWIPVDHGIVEGDVSEQEYLRCEDCWQYSAIGTAHVCDPVMKILCDKAKRRQAAPREEEPVLEPMIWDEEDEQLLKEATYDLDHEKIDD